jgi:predicted MarR family transcription regulator
MSHSHHFFTGGEKKLTELQVELLKSLKYMTTEKQLADIKSLLRHYFTHQLDKSIDKVEKEKGYTAAVYESWLNSKKKIE